jgi:hypothetical protein
MKPIGNAPDNLAAANGTTARLHARGRAGGHFERDRRPTNQEGKPRRGKEGDVTNNLLAWYPHPEPRGTSCYAADLSEPQAVVRLFARAAQFRAHVTAQGWRFLWTHYGLAGLLEINRRAGWFDPEDDREAAAQMIDRARIEGYDPSSDRVRGFVERTEALEYVH